MDADQFRQLLQSQQRLIEAIIQNSRQVQQQQPGDVTSTSTINTALLPNFETYDAAKESFRNYKQRFENYLQMKKVSSDKKYCAQLLLNSIGASNFNMIAALGSPKQPSELTYDELMDILEKHLAPKKNVLVAQHQFLSKYQTSDQKIADYVATLRSDLSDCDFISPCECKVSIADTFLRAQFIRGLRDNSIREQLLQSENVQFNELVIKAIALESAKSDSRTLSHKSLNDNSSAAADINKIYQGKKNKNNCPPHKRSSRDRQPSQMQNRSSRSKSRLNYRELGIDNLCLRCGASNHLSPDCRIDKTSLHCSSCKSNGHVVKVCISTLLKRKKEKLLSQQDAKQISAYPENIEPVHIKPANIELEDTDNLCRFYGVSHIVDLKNKSVNALTERFYAEILIEKELVKFEVDSGAPYTFLPRNVYADLNLDVTMSPPEIGFRSYTHTVFVPDGKINVKAEFNGIIINEEIYIVPEDYDAIIGRVWIRKLGINLADLDNCASDIATIKSINAIENMEQIADMYPTLCNGKIGRIPDFVVSLKLRQGAKPIFHRERNVPYALQKKVDAELDTLEAQGVLTKSETSDWGSPLVVIPKADGGVRLCVDYKVGVNERLQDAHYHIRQFNDILNSLKNSRFFCRLDLFKAYLHIPVDEQSSEIQTISTHRGTYRVNRLSFGIKTAPSEFNRIIDQILRDVPKTLSYFDDILIHGSTREECQRNLIACLDQLQKFDLHINQQKCSLFQERIEYLGHVIEYNKISKSPEKVAAIVNMPRPKSADDVRRFLGMVTYYSRFIDAASTITTPLRRLLCKNTAFKWTSECEAAFLKLKQAIASDQVLVPYDPDLPLQLACDASPTGIAGVLSHIVDGQEQPIAFASRALSAAEQNYSQLDREALAIVFAVDHFFQYLFGRQFKLVTDNQPLVRIFHHRNALPKMTAGRLQRYAAFLCGFDYVIDFKKGIENSNVDCLSRASINTKNYTVNAINNEVKQICDATINQISSSTVNYQLIKEETGKDATLSVILQSLQEDNTSEPDYVIEGGILFRGQRVVIPERLQPAILQELHRTHVGITKMKQLARRYVYWRKIDTDIEHLVRSCPQCANTRSSPEKAPSHPWEDPDSNWQRIHIDYAGPYQNHHFLVVVDAKSKWAEVVPCSSAPSSRSTIEILKDLFARHGFPEVMVSDNATIFTSQEFAQFSREAGIFQKFSAPGHPATNGLAERYVQTLKHRLITMSEEGQSIRQKVREILFRYRATPLNNGKTPAEQYLNRQIRFQLDAIRPINFQESITPVQPARQLREGDRVLARYYSNNKVQWRPGKVVRKFGKLHYQIELDDGFIFKRHIDQLRSTEVPPPPPPPPRKTVSFKPDAINVPNLGDLTEVIAPQDPDPPVAEPDPMEHEPNVPVLDQDPPEQLTVEARPQRERRIPGYLRDYLPYHR